MLSLSRIKEFKSMRL